MAGRRWGRDFVNRAYDRATAKNEAEAQRVKDGGAKRKKRVLSGVFTGPLDQVDWLTCHCGYQPPTSGGKKVPQYADPAYAVWTEGTPRTAGKQSLHTHIKTLVKDVYTTIGYHHNTVALGTDPGWPDLTLIGPGEPNIMFREEKAMRCAWEEGQREHLLSMQQKGFDVGVWKPCCLLSGRVELELARLADIPPQGRGLQRQRGQLNRQLTWKDIADGALGES
jgi:hypothetical protein